ncbi:unnamed protein product [Linum trigynum]|uniref:Uncharacterized protein n=1 Tax=Linum trigynum TaxID=586398 RepID=A0AAV2DI52_9ROSI
MTGSSCSGEKGRDGCRDSDPSLVSLEVPDPITNFCSASDSKAEGEEEGKIEAAATTRASSHHGNGGSAVGCRGGRRLAARGTSPTLNRLYPTHISPIMSRPHRLIRRRFIKSDNGYMVRLDGGPKC